MFCGECGTENPEINSFCKNCGKPLRKPVAAEAPVTQPGSPGKPESVPAPLSGASGTASAGWTTGKKLGIASIIFGILALGITRILFPYTIPLIAIVLGILGLRYRYKPAVIGIILGVLVILVDYFYIFIFR